MSLTRRHCVPSSCLRTVAYGAFTRGAPLLTQRARTCVAAQLFRGVREKCSGVDLGYKCSYSERWLAQQSLLGMTNLDRLARTGSCSWHGAGIGDLSNLGCLQTRLVEDHRGDGWLFLVSQFGCHGPAREQSAGKYNAYKVRIPANSAQIHVEYGADQTQIFLLYVLSFRAADFRKVLSGKELRRSGSQKSVIKYPPERGCYRDAPEEGALRGHNRLLPSALAARPVKLHLEPITARMNAAVRCSDFRTTGPLLWGRTGFDRVARSVSGVSWLICWPR
jgi:hypothetical protein